MRIDLPHVAPSGSGSVPARSQPDSGLYRKLPPHPGILKHLEKP